MTTEQRIELCKIYNNSDIEALDYMRKFIDESQKELLDRVYHLNGIIHEWITEGDDDFEPYDVSMEDEYYEGKWKLLNSFWIENRDGDAFCDGVFYQ
jgi:hypothetical protein